MKSLSKKQLRLQQAKKDVHTSAKAFDKAEAKYKKSIDTVRKIESTMSVVDIQEVNAKFKG